MADNATTPSSRSGANTVLVIEDDAAVRRALARMLKSEGFGVLEAQDGSEAVHLYGDHAEIIVAATLDLMMPMTDGRETLAMLSSFAPDLPIVVSTAMPMPTDMIGRAPGSRGVGYLQKPYTPVELAAEVRRVIAEMQS
jgi:two-component system cell cycle sensor histidine kinase/response regulator CckA